MGQRCVLRGCKNKGRNTAELKYHRFPRDPSVKQMWEEWVSLHNGKIWIAYKSAVICSAHFSPDQYANALLLPDSVPCIPPPPVDTVPSNSFSSTCAENTSSPVTSTPPPLTSASTENVPPPLVSSIPNSEPTSIPVLNNNSPIMPSSIGVNFMTVPVLSNSVLGVTPNVVIKVLDQQQLPTLQINPPQLTPLSQTESAIQAILPENMSPITEVDCIKVENIHHESGDESKPEIDTDPLALYGDLSQFIIFKSNTCPTQPTDSQTNTPLLNGLCGDTYQKTEIGFSLPSGNFSLANIKTEIVDNCPDPSLSAMTIKTEIVDNCPDPSLSAMTPVKSEGGSLPHSDLPVKSNADVEDGTQSSLPSDGYCETQNFSNTTDSCLPAVESELTTKINTALDSSFTDEEYSTNDPLPLHNANSLPHSTAEAPTSPENPSLKRHIDSESSPTAVTSSKKAKRFVGDMLPEDFESPTSRATNLSRLKDIINDKTRRLDNTQRTVRRLKERMKALESLLTHLKEDINVSGYVNNIIRQKFPQLDKP